MSAVQIILGILVILVSLAIIIAVLFQEGRRAGINGAISGAREKLTNTLLDLRTSIDDMIECIKKEDR